MQVEFLALNALSISTAISHKFCSQGREPMENSIIKKEKNRITINLHESFVELGQVPEVSNSVDPVINRIILMFTA